MYTDSIFSCVYVSKSNRFFNGDGNFYRYLVFSWLTSFAHDCLLYHMLLITWWRWEIKRMCAWCCLLFTVERTTADVTRVSFSFFEPPLSRVLFLNPTYFIITPCSCLYPSTIPLKTLSDFFHDPSGAKWWTYPTSMSFPFKFLFRNDRVRTETTNWTCHLLLLT